MPCFDKKLEASREELTDRWWRSSNHDSATATASPVRDVDCVITSRELLTLASVRGIQLSSLPLKPLSRSERAPFPDSRISEFLFPRSPQPSASKNSSTSTTAAETAAGTSGGYLYHILATEQAKHPGSTINVQRGRNADVIEYILLPSSPSPTAKPIMKCARYYGFRNIQNLVRKLKPARQSKLPGAARRTATANGMGAGGNEYAYVEVMACPGGCTNGGGQIKVEDVVDTLPVTRSEAVTVVNGTATPQGQKEWLRRVDEAYFSADEDVEENGYDVNEDDDVPMTNGCEDASNHSPTVINNVNVTRVQDLLAHWPAVVQVPLQTLAYTSYRYVDSDVGKASKAKVKTLNDTERIAQIAGLSGGGW